MRVQSSQLLPGKFSSNACDKKKSNALSPVFSAMWGVGGELPLQLMGLIRRHVFSDPLFTSQRHFTSDRFVSSLRRPIWRPQSHADTAIPGLAWAPTAHYHTFRM